MLTLPANAIDETGELARRANKVATDTMEEPADALVVELSDAADGGGAARTVKQLRELLKQNDLPTHGSKAELLQRAREAGLLDVVQVEA